MIPKNIKCYVGELLATVFLATGFYSACANVYVFSDDVGDKVTFAFIKTLLFFFVLLGFIAVPVAVFSDISPTHMNPLLTVATMFYGKTPIPTGILLIVMQIIGAGLGYLIVMLMVPINYVDLAKIIVPGSIENASEKIIKTNSTFVSFFIECYFSFIVSYVLFSLVVNSPNFDKRSEEEYGPNDDKKRPNSVFFIPLALGLTFASVSTLGMAYINSYFNPALVLFPGFIGKKPKETTLWIIAELLGGIIGGGVQSLLLKATVE